MASNSEEVAPSVPKPKDLLERLHDREAVLCAEGYLMSFERRGYLQAGPFVPEVVLGRPDLVRMQYEEFVHAGSDVVLAFTYYTYRARLKQIGKEDQLELINRYALRLAKRVALQTGTLMAGNICDTSLYIPDNIDSKEAVKAIFREQVGWAVQEGADYVVGETFGHVGEAIAATEVIKEAGLPAVVTLRVTNQFFVDGKLATFDGIELGQALQMLQNAGADVIGFNCSTGPRTMLSLIAQYRKYVQVPFAALPVAYRTNEKEVTFHDLTDPVSGQKVFPNNLDCVQCSRDEIAEFGRQCARLGVQYLGICCGNNAGFTRALAESIGRVTPASRFRPDMSKYVSDLQRRLVYLQKLKKITDDEQTEQHDSNDVEQRDEDEMVKHEVANTKEPKSDTEQQSDDEVTPNDDSSNTANTTATEENATVDDEVVDSKSDSSSDTFNIRLPPPPGSEFKRTDSKRSRGSASSLDSNPISNDSGSNIDANNAQKKLSVSSSDSFSVRLPPPPARGDTPTDSWRKRASSSSSSSSDSDSDGNDIRLPSPSELSNRNIDTDGKEAPEHNDVNGNSPVNTNDASLIAVATDISDEVSRTSSASANAPENENISLSVSSPEGTKETDQTLEENTIQEKTDEPLSLLEENKASSPVTLHHESNAERNSPLLDVSPSLSAPVTVQEQDWADFSPPASKSKEANDSAASSGDEEQMGYIRLEKDDEDGQEHSQNWANFSTTTPNLEHNNSPLVEVTESKPEEMQHVADQWADFSAIRNDNELVDNTKESISTDNNLNLVSFEPSEQIDTQSSGAVSIGLNVEYEDSEA